jgi:hypothetical protein
MDRPRLRKVDRTLLRRGDELLVVLRDPLGLAEPAAFPQEAAQVLDMLDGQRTAAQIRQSLLLRERMNLSLEDIRALLAELGEAGYLDDDRFRGMWDARAAGSWPARSGRPASPVCSTPRSPTSCARRC